MLTHATCTHAHSPVSPSQALHTHEGLRKLNACKCILYTVYKHTLWDACGLTTSGDLPQMYMPSLPEPSDRKYIPQGSTVSGTAPDGPSGQWNTNTILLRGDTGRGTHMVGLGWEGSPMPASLATCPAHAPAALTRCRQGRTTFCPSLWTTYG